MANHRLIVIPIHYIRLGDFSYNYIRKIKAKPKTDIGNIMSKIRVIWTAGDFSKGLAGIILILWLYFSVTLKLSTRDSFYFLIVLLIIAGFILYKFSEKK